MSLGGERWRFPAKWLGVLAAAVLGPLMFSAPALAAAGSAAISPTTTTTTGTENPDLGYAALGFGFLAILLVLLFIRWDRHQTLEVQEHLAADGLTPQPRDVPTGDDAAGASAEVGGAAATVVDGPDHLRVRATADFVARRDGQQIVARWTANPPGVLGVPREETSRVTVTALKPGTVMLTAGDGTGKRVVVTAPGRPPLGLSFIGEGWGHVVVAIVLASITAALGLAGALSGEAVATLLGALVGYVVAKSQSGSPAGHSSALKPGVADTVHSED